MREDNRRGLIGVVSNGGATYACIWCDRLIDGEVQENGTAVFVHDNVPHPDDATFDEEERPQ